MRFKNTDLLRPAAIAFEKNGSYTSFQPGTKDWSSFWVEERRRCVEGYEVGGMRITGYHYFYLNYFRIARTVTKTLNGLEYQEREHLFPRFYDGDYDFFWIVDICRYGITKEKYETLNLGVEIHPDDLSGGKQLTVLKARRKGYSYKVASMLCRNYYHLKRSKNFAMAFDKKYLEGDGIYQKFIDGMSFNDEFCAWAQPKLVDRTAQMHVVSGYVKNMKGKNVPSGFQSSVTGISLKDNPDGARGKAGELIVFEEMGKFPGLKKAWDVTHHTVKQGTSSLGLMIAFGTGGTEGADFSGAEKLFYNPRENGCIRIANKWDIGGEGTWCGHFVPIYQNLEGFIDEEGNSDEQKARSYEEEEREAKKSGTSETLSQYIAETPFMPSEATLSVDQNLFPINELVAQRNSIKVHRRENFGIPMRLVDSGGKIKAIPDPDLKPIYEFPHNHKGDLTGAIVIYEQPFKDSDGNVPKEMYIVCHDPYAQDNSGNKGSLGSAYVVKRSNNLSQTFHDCIVASYNARPSSQDEYNRNLFNLAEYYNAKIGFENDRGDVIGYAKRFRKLHFLEEEFTMLDKKELQSKTVKRAFGMHMTEARKRQGEIYIRDWLLTPITMLEDGSKVLILDTIVDPALIEELIHFNHDGNFDRVMSLMIGMYHLKEKFNKQVSVSKKAITRDEFFNRPFT